jgi:Protein of unknown function (DUF1592)/Protein of unknown function (DUF1588)/Protein of unknown function (DUF1595)/Protein of unknown function (DUF1585)/Protein of unknown function (DUF1587)
MGLMRELVCGVGWRTRVACGVVLGAVACGKAELGGSAGRAGNPGSAGSGMGGDSASGNAGRPDANAGASARAGSNAGGDSGGESGAAGDESASLAPAPSLRRLTASEFAFTVGDVLGTAQKPDLSTFDTEVDGFDNNVAANGVSDPLYYRYLQTAESLADEVFASDVLRPTIVTCAEADDPSCVRQVISETGLRLFRRPVLEDELVGYQHAYTRARARNLSHEGALKEVLIALLASAQFLYRVEFVPTERGTQPICPYDLATRLSYLLWSSAPDQALLDAAQQSALASDAQLAATVERLLGDPKSQRFVQSFAGQWLGLHRLTQTSFDPKAIPDWSPDMANAAAYELQAFFSELLGPGQDWLGFLKSPVHFVNIPLATLYNVSVRDGTVRLELSGVDRRGFLGLVGFLAQTSSLSRSSPSARGEFILRELLCGSLPAPPGDMPTFNDNEDAIRDYLNGLSPECASCHVQFDGFGLALESYDAIGRYRTTYADFNTVDANATLPVSVSTAGASVSGVTPISEALANTPAFTSCTVQKLYTYGFGRAFGDSERGNVQALAQQWRSGALTMRDLILELVQSRAFRARSDGGSL